MIVHIASRINVDGQWWDIVTDHIVDDDLPPEKKTGRIKGIIKGLSSTGSIISRIGASPPPTGEAIEPERAANQPPAQTALFNWPAPGCPDHNEDMAQSKVQKDGDVVHYYCPKRTEGAYCVQRAKVEIKTGIPKFWTVRG